MMKEEPLPTGDYLIVNKLTGQCLDANSSAAKQYSSRHPRCFMNSYVNICCPTQKWYVSVVPSSDKSTPVTYMLQQGEHSLDGNYSYIPQFQSSAPSPYMWPFRPDAKNHMWILLDAGKTQSSENTFLIMNYSNKKVLDGNVDSVGQMDIKHKSPYLTAYSATKVQPNQCWQFIKWPEDSADLLRNGVYMIQNCQSEQFLKRNHYSVNTGDLSQCEGVSHLWYISGIHANEYTIEPIDEIYLEEPTYLALRNIKDRKPDLSSVNPMTTMASQFRWKLMKGPNYQTDRSVLVINTATGLCWDGLAHTVQFTGDIPPPCMSKLNITQRVLPQFNWRFIPSASYGQIINVLDERPE